LTTGIPNFSSLAQPWRELGEIYRRICSLRAQGRPADARALEEGDFATALAAIRVDAGPGPETEERVQTVLAAEEDRVADAGALAELLLPLLAQHLRNAPIAEAPPAARARPVKTSAPHEAPSVADFIDDMLAQERASRPRPS
jgi:hypothetical protein